MSWATFPLFGCRPPATTSIVRGTCPQSSADEGSSSDCSSGLVLALGWMRWKYLFNIQAQHSCVPRLQSHTRVRPASLPRKLHISALDCKYPHAKPMQDTKRVPYMDLPAASGYEAVEGSVRSQSAGLRSAVSSLLYIRRPPGATRPFLDPKNKPVAPAKCLQ